MLIPQVVGFKLHGQLREGATATDLVLTVTQMLRKKGVVGKFVEFYGPGIAALALPDRATIANMAPEYGATMGFFPVDEETLAYLRFTGRDQTQVELVEAYCKEQGLFRTAGTAEPDVLRHARARPRHRRAVAGRPEAAAGSRAAVEDEDGLRSKALDEMAEKGAGPRRRAKQTRRVAGRSPAPCKYGDSATARW